MGHSMKFAAQLFFAAGERIGQRVLAVRAQVLAAPFDAPFAAQGKHGKRAAEETATHQSGEAAGNRDFRR